jgi:hypothetical protein
VRQDTTRCRLDGGPRTFRKEETMSKLGALIARLRATLKL